MADYEYIARRLQRMAVDALLEAQKATVKIESEAAIKGAHGGSRMHLHVHETLGKALQDALVRMSAFTYTASGETSDQAAQALQRGGSKFVDDVVSWLDKKYNSAGSAAFGGYSGPPLSKLEETLRDIVLTRSTTFTTG